MNECMFGKPMPREEHETRWLLYDYATATTTSNITDGTYTISVRYEPYNQPGLEENRQFPAVWYD